MTNLGSGTGTLEVCMSCLNVFAIDIYNVTGSSASSYGWCHHWKKWRMHQQHTANLWCSIAVS